MRFSRGQQSPSRRRGRRDAGAGMGPGFGRVAGPYRGCERAGNTPCPDAAGRRNHRRPDGLRLRGWLDGSPQRSTPGRERGQRPSELHGRCARRSFDTQDLGWQAADEPVGSEGHVRHAGCCSAPSREAAWRRPSTPGPRVCQEWSRLSLSRRAMPTLKRMSCQASMRAADGAGVGVGFRLVPRRGSCVRLGDPRKSLLLDWRRSCTAR